MTRAFAEANNYDAAPPPTATLLSLANANPNVHRLNNAPVIAEPDFSVVDVGDFVNFPTLRFFADDNDDLMGSCDHTTTSAIYKMTVTAGGSSTAGVSGPRSTRSPTKTARRPAGGAPLGS